MDVHQSTISVAVRDANGKLVVECILETKASTIVEFIRGLTGTLYVTFEEGTSAAWLYELLQPHVAQVIVCLSRVVEYVSVAGRQLGSAISCEDQIAHQ